MHSRQGGRTDAQAADATSGALHVRRRGVVGLDDRCGQGRPGVPGVHSGAPLPARRGDALGRCPGGLFRVVPYCCRSEFGGIHRLLWGALHGGVGRRVDGRPPTGAAPRPQRRVLHGRHGGHRPGGGGVGRAESCGGRGPVDPGHLHELGGVFEGLRGAARRCRLYLVERPGGADLGLGSLSGAGRAGAVLPGPAFGEEHGLRARVRRRRHARLEPAAGAGRR